MPADLKEILAKYYVTKAFDELVYFKRKEIVLWIIDIRKDETRLNRIKKVLVLIDLRKGLNDHFIRSITSGLR